MSARAALWLSLYDCTLLYHARRMRREKTRAPNTSLTSLLLIILWRYALFCGSTAWKANQESAARPEPRRSRHRISIAVSLSRRMALQPVILSHAAFQISSFLAGIIPQTLLR